MNKKLTLLSLFLLLSASVLFAQQKKFYGTWGDYEISVSNTILEGAEYHILIL